MKHPTKNKSLYLIHYNIMHRFNRSVLQFLCDYLHVFESNFLLVTGKNLLAVFQILV